MSPPPSCSLICQDCVHCTKSSFAFCRGQEKCGDCRHACLKLLIYAAWVLVLSEVLWQQHRSSGGSGHLKNSVPLEYRSVNERGIVFFRGPGVRIQLGNSGQRIIHTHPSLSLFLFSTPFQYDWTFSDPAVVMDSPRRGECLPLLDLNICPGPEAGRGWQAIPSRHKGSP